MAIKVFDRYGPRANPADGNYPNGSFKNESVPGANDGTPLEVATINDLQGFTDALMSDVGDDANGNVDTAVSSQRLQALKKSAAKATAIPFVNVADLKTGTSRNGVLDMTLFVGSEVRWDGYDSPFDGGGNHGVIKSGAHVDDGGSIFSIDANTYVESDLSDGKINVMKFGGTSQGYVNLAATGKNIYTPPGNFTITDDIILQDGQSFTGEKGKSKIDLSAIIGIGLHTKAGGYIMPSATSVYYKDEPYVSAGWTRPTITVNATPDSTTLTVSDASELAVGDWISVTNGYCDMWRVLETSGEEYQKIIDPSVDLWKNAIHQIKGIAGNVITLEEKLGFDCPIIPKTYGFFPDENDLPGYAGYNVPSVEKLIGAADVEISGVEFTNDTTRTILGYSPVRPTVKKCSITHEANTEKPIELYTSIGAKVYANDVRAQGFSYSIRRSSRGAIMWGNSAEFGGFGDGPALFWERAYQCVSGEFSCSTYGAGASSAQIGFYMNTCHSCVVSGVAATGFGRAVQIGFGGEGCVASDVSAFDCDVIFGGFAARDFQCVGGTLEGSLTASGNQFTDSVITVSSCYRGSFDDVTQSPLVDPAEYSGRIHMSQSIGLEFNNVQAPNAWFHASTEDDLTSYQGVPRATSNGCHFHSFEIVSTTFDQAYTRPAVLNKTKLANACRVNKTHYTEFNDCELLETLVLIAAPYTKLRRTKIDSAVSGIDFGASGADSGRFRSSMLDLQDCQIDAPSHYRYYVNPETAINGGTIPAYALGGGEITLMDQYPLDRIYKNPGQYGTVAGWVVVRESPGYV